MVIIDFAIGVLILALVVMGVVKLADKLKIVQTIRSWGKKDDNDKEQ